MGRKSEQSRTVYNHLARDYDASPEGRYTVAHRAALVERVPLRDGDQILDVGCGNGALLGALSQKARVNAFGVDLSENMIASARERHPDCVFSVSQCAPLAFESQSMDVITVCCAFHHFEAPRAFVEECMRVLKKGGAVFLAEPNFSPVVRWLANRAVFPFSRSGDVRVYSQRELRGFFASAGFTGIETEAAGLVLVCSARK